MIFGHPPRRCRRWSGLDRRASRPSVPARAALTDILFVLKTGLPRKLHADKAYDHRRCRDECRARGIKPRIARRGVDTSQRLGRHRWVVECAHASMARLRRLAARYERREDIHRPSLPSDPRIY